MGDGHLNLRDCLKTERVGSVEGWLLDEQTVYLRFHAQEVTLDEIHESRNVRVALVGNEKEYRCLTDVRAVRSATAEARRFPPHATTQRLAILYGSPVGRMIGNAYLRIRPPHCPTKLFADESKAMEWLKA